MTIITDITKNELIPALENISGVTVLDGWITHYAHKFSEAGQDLVFPVVSIQPESEKVNFNGQRTRATVTRTFRVIGAVSNKNPEIVTDDLSKLLYDVRKALAFNLYDNDYLMNAIDFVSCSFDLPEKGEPYAFFEQIVTVDFQENYE